MAKLTLFGGSGNLIMLGRDCLWVVGDCSKIMAGCGSLWVVNVKLWLLAGGRTI